MNPDSLYLDQHIVLLPGLDGSGSLFKLFIQQFPDPARITVIPYPLDRHISHEQLDDYIIPLLPTDAPLILLGESYSGPIALRLAARDDLTIHSVILVATFAKYPASFFKIIPKIAPLSLLFRLPIPDFVIQHYCFGDAKNKVLNALLRKAIRANKPKVLARRAHDGAAMDVTNLLAKIKRPCLYITASNDKLVPGKAIEHLKKHLPDLEVATLQGGHFILQTQPQACFHIIHKFLCKLAKKKAT